MNKVIASHYPYELPPRDSMRRVAWVIIDMQRDFVEPGGFWAALGNQVEPLQKIVPTVAGLLKTFRELRLPIVHTREGYRPDLSDCPQPKEADGLPPHRRPGAEGTHLGVGRTRDRFCEGVAPPTGRTCHRQTGERSLFRHKPPRTPAGPFDQSFDFCGIDHRGLCPNQHKRSQRPRARMSLNGKWNRKLFS